MRCVEAPNADEVACFWDALTDEQKIDLFAFDDEIVDAIRVNYEALCEADQALQNYGLDALRALPKLSKGFVYSFFRSKLFGSVNEKTIIFTQLCDEFVFVEDFIDKVRTVCSDFLAPKMKHGRRSREPMRKPKWVELTKTPSQNWGTFECMLALLLEQKLWACCSVTKSLKASSLSADENAAELAAAEEAASKKTKRKKGKGGSPQAAAHNDPTERLALAKKKKSQRGDEKKERATREEAAKEAARLRQALEDEERATQKRKDAERRLQERKEDKKRREEEKQEKLEEERKRKQQVKPAKTAAEVRDAEIFMASLPERIEPSSWVVVEKKRTERERKAGEERKRKQAEEEQRIRKEVAERELQEEEERKRIQVEEQQLKIEEDRRRKQLEDERHEEEDRRRRQLEEQRLKEEEVKKRQKQLEEDEQQRAEERDRRQLVQREEARRKMEELETGVGLQQEQTHNRAHVAGVRPVDDTRAVGSETLAAASVAGTPGALSEKKASWWELTEEDDACRSPASPQALRVDTAPHEAEASGPPRYAKGESSGWEHGRYGDAHPAVGSDNCAYREEVRNYDSEALKKREAWRKDEWIDELLYGERQGRNNRQSGKNKNEWYSNRWREGSDRGWDKNWDWNRKPVRSKWNDWSSRDWKSQHPSRGTKGAGFKGGGSKGSAKNGLAGTPEIEKSTGEPFNPASRPANPSPRTKSPAGATVTPETTAATAPASQTAPDPAHLIPSQEPAPTEMLSQKACVKPSSPSSLQSRSAEVSTTAPEKSCSMSSSSSQQSHPSSVRHSCAVSAVSARPPNPSASSSATRTPAQVRPNAWTAWRNRSAAVVIGGSSCAGSAGNIQSDDTLGRKLSRDHPKHPAPAMDATYSPPDTPRECRPGTRSEKDFPALSGAASSSSGVGARRERPSSSMRQSSPVAEESHSETELLPMPHYPAPTPKMMRTQ